MCHHTVYHWSRELLHRELPRFGVEMVPNRMAGELPDRRKSRGELPCVLHHSRSINLPLMILRVAVSGIASTTSRRSGHRNFVTPFSSR